MTLLQTTDEHRPNSFYNPICTSGYLTPLQRKKLREKRNLNLLSDVPKELEISNKSKNTLKVIKKAKAKRTPKLKSNEKVIKKVLKQKDNFPQLQCSIANLVGQNKDDNPKEKRFFKNRSPQHLKKAKFVMPLTYKKGLDFTVTAPLQLVKGNVKEISHNNSIMETSTKSMEFGSSLEACATENHSNSFNEKVTSNSNIEETVIKNCSSSDISNPQVSESLENSDSHESKEMFDKFDFFEFNWPSDEVLLERERRARAKLRESLAAAKSDFSFEDLNRSSINIEEISQSKKLFPIFNINQKASSKNQLSEKEQINKQSKGKKKYLNIIDNSKGSEQLIIDAGQKEIGAKICKTCGMIYTIGQEEDEKLHAGYHQTYLINLKFLGWKKERVVGNYMDGRIIQVKDTDENFSTKKIKDILFIVNRDLGFSAAELPVRSNVMILLFISNDKRVNGCLVAEEIQSASRVVSAETSEKSDGRSIWKLGSWYASSEIVPAICGVNRIWVSHDFRRRKVASRLVDCLRKNFLYGYFVDQHELAFTDPTVDGREFAASYTGTDNFLVYK
ncbi:N-acetyltransferase ESCO2-like [Argiope bruennichi]|uniref:N-acetyltransferase ESCO2-like n=1 Tax=Argiope bruennichi TaxID=94029 RepID=UPI0024941150|nr:N-acetyltransferase ESCO2-like [Argiope bruennichi]